MKKEVLIAVVVGLVLGLLITYIFYQMRKMSLENDKPQTSLEEVTATQTTPTPTPISTINILTPEEGTVQNEASTVVSGTTIPNAYTVLFVNEQEHITTSDADGNFSFTVELITGSNVLVIHVLNEAGETTTVERVVIVSDALQNLDQYQSASPSAQKKPTN